MKKLNSCPPLKKIIETMKRLNYKVFDNPRGYDLNIVGVRSDDLAADTFNDWLVVFYLQGEEWIHFAFPYTTDPGVYYREHPMNEKGTLIMKPGQYLQCYRGGKHRGYDALQQCGPITVFRDANRDSMLDTEGVEEETGLFAANIHHAGYSSVLDNVGMWSGGCQVVGDIIHWDFFYALYMQARKWYGNLVSYTLLTEADLRGETKPQPDPKKEGKKKKKKTKSKKNKASKKKKKEKEEEVK